MRGRRSTSLTALRPWTRHSDIGIVWAGATKSRASVPGRRAERPYLAHLSRAWARIRDLRSGLGGATKTATSSPREGSTSLTAFASVDAPFQTSAAVWAGARKGRDLRPREERRGRRPYLAHLSRAWARCIRDLRGGLGGSLPGENLGLRPGGLGMGTAPMSCEERAPSFERPDPLGNPIVRSSSIKSAAASRSRWGQRPPLAFADTKALLRMTVISSSHLKRRHLRGSAVADDKADRKPQRQNDQRI
jgi:hypothetical protein